MWPALLSEGSPSWAPVSPVDLCMRSVSRCSSVWFPSCFSVSFSRTCSSHGASKVLVFPALSHLLLDLPFLVSVFNCNPSPVLILEFPFFIMSSYLLKLFCPLIT